MSSSTLQTGSPPKGNIVERLRRFLNAPAGWGLGRLVYQLVFRHHFYVFPADRRRHQARQAEGRTLRRPTLDPVFLDQRDRQRDNAVTRLRLGTYHFNPWRHQQNHAPLWLADTDLSGLDLSGVDWRGCVLIRVSFAGSNLRRCTFAGAILHEVAFEGADLTDAVFAEHDLAGMSLPETITPASGRPNPWLLPLCPVKLSLIAEPVHAPNGDLKVKLVAHNQQPDTVDATIQVQAGLVNRTLSVTLAGDESRTLTINLKKVPLGAPAWATAKVGDGSHYRMERIALRGQC